MSSLYTYIYIYIYIYIPVSIATSKNPSVVNSIYISAHSATLYDYLKKLAIQINVATDEGNSRAGMKCDTELTIKLE